jgi:hypothetical protein
MCRKICTNERCCPAAVYEIHVTSPCSLPVQKRCSGKRWLVSLPFPLISPGKCFSVPVRRLPGPRRVWTPWWREAALLLLRTESRWSISQQVTSLPELSYATLQTVPCFDDYHLLGDDNHHSHRRGNLKSYTVPCFIYQEMTTKNAFVSWLCLPLILDAKMPSCFLFNYFWRNKRPYSLSDMSRLDWHLSARIHILHHGCHVFIFCRVLWSVERMG